jgi:NDP-hexose C3-ketoreductase / dTDP-4-oxo-2-deoxy-alpha-D-pentos-2-ene 2,3-reductase
VQPGKWVLSNPAVYSGIVGVRTEAHLEGLAEASELELDDSTLQRLNEIFPYTVNRPLAPGPAPEAFAW